MAKSKRVDDNQSSPSKSKEPVVAVGTAKLDTKDTPEKG
jgi:hypothetical protein